MAGNYKVGRYGKEGIAVVPFYVPFMLQECYNSVTVVLTRAEQ
jgi:hypothetical protein